MRILDAVLQIIKMYFAGTPTGTTNPCHAGSYSPNRGNTMWEQCEDCPKGNYCPEGSSNPTPCPA